MRNAENNVVKVRIDGTKGPYIIVSVDRIDEVRQALTDASIAGIPDPNALLMNNRPSMGVINLVNEADVDAAQAVLNALD